MNRNKVLVVLVFTSILVVSTQAFSVTNQPVIIDWHYNQWGDSGLVIVTDSETYTQVAANQVTFSFQLQNLGDNDETGAIIRVELVDVDGNRVQSDSYTDGSPDDDAQWLIATETITMSPFNSPSTWDVGPLTFQGDNIDLTIAAGGKFIIFTSAGTTMDSYDKLYADRIPVLAVDPQTLLATAATLATGWNGDTAGVSDAFDGSLTTFAYPTVLTVETPITFTWSGVTGTELGASDIVDVKLVMRVVGFSASARHRDTLTITLKVGGSPVATSVHTADIGDASTSVTIIFSSVSAPGGDGWVLAEVGTITVEITSTISRTADALNPYSIYEVYVVATTP